MPTVSLDGARILDWETFHTECRHQFGFPDFYGRNMDAWVDCLSYLRDEDGMCKYRLEADDVLKIEVANADRLRQTMPEILDELAFCVAAINERYADYGEKPALQLVLT
ncbi:MAG TPA: barstar family protein [Burkholderiaceae bacterium]